MSALMRRSFLQPSTSLSDQAYVELVQSLFASLLPSVVMTTLFAGVAALTIRATGDELLVLLGLAGTVVSAMRLAVVFLSRSSGIDQRITDRGSARRHERAFGLCYTGFALILGLFGARAMALGHTGAHMVVSALLVGYAAGVAAGVSLRPRIAATSMLAAVVLPAATSLVRLETFHVALAIVLLALLAGGLHSVQARYRVEVDKIEMRRTISGLARRDHLTGLPNRLGLAERFEEVTRANASDCLIAVHCIDLECFKPVNDRHGHPVGDELLRLVARRLSGSLRQGDLAARVGGDEFIVLQGGMRHPDEADLLARRLAKILSEPYAMNDLALSVGVSVGYVVSSCGDILEDCVQRADNALYAIKAAGGGAAGHSELEVGKALVSRG